jgi:hypothetical protein
MAIAQNKELGKEETLGMKREALSIAISYLQVLDELTICRSTVAAYRFVAKGALEVAETYLKNPNPGLDEGMDVLTASSAARAMSLVTEKVDQGTLMKMLKVAARAGDDKADEKYAELTAAKKLHDAEEGVARNLMSLVANAVCAAADPAFTPGSLAQVKYDARYLDESREWASRLAKD